MCSQTPKVQETARTESELVQPAENPLLNFACNVARIAVDVTAAPTKVWEAFQWMRQASPADEGAQALHARHHLVAAREKLAQFNNPQLTEAYEKLVVAVEHGDKAGARDAWREMREALSGMDRDERAKVMHALFACGDFVRDGRLRALLRREILEGVYELVKSEVRSTKRIANSEELPLNIAELRPAPFSTGSAQDEMTWLLRLSPYDEKSPWRIMADLLEAMGAAARLKQGERAGVQDDRGQDVQRAFGAALRVVASVGERALHTSAMREFIGRALNPQIVDTEAFQGIAESQLLEAVRSELGQEETLLRGRSAA
jgi:hypothetical protein